MTSYLLLLCIIYVSLLEPFARVPASDDMSQYGTSSSNIQTNSGTGNFLNGNSLWSLLNTPSQSFISPFYRSPYIPYFGQDGEQQQEQKRKQNILSFIRNNPAVKGPSVVWSQNFAGNNYQRLMPNTGWSQYYQKLQAENSLRNNWFRNLYNRNLDLMRYVSNRQQQILRQPEYQQLLTPTNPTQIRRYYEWKYPGFARLSEAEKQKRVAMGSYLLTPLKDFRKNMQPVDLRHIIHSNKSFNSLYRHFKGKPTVLMDISNTLQKSNFESDNPASPLGFVTIKGGGRTPLIPTLDKLGNLHLDVNKKDSSPKPAVGTDYFQNQQIQSNLKGFGQFVPRLDSLGNLHLDRASQIFYNTAHPVTITRERARQIALQRARISTTRRINPLVYNKMLQTQFAPTNLANYNLLINKQQTGLPIIRTKTPAKPNSNLNVFFAEQQTKLPIMRQKTVSPISQQQQFENIFTTPALIRSRFYQKKQQDHLPMIRLLMPTQTALNRTSLESENSQLYNSLNSLFKQQGFQKAEVEQPITGVPLIRSKPTLAIAQKSLQPFAGLPLIRVQPKLASIQNPHQSIKQDEIETLAYPKPKIEAKKGIQAKSALAITPSHPLQNIEPLHGNTALKVQALRRENEGKLVQFLQQQNPTKKYLELLKNALGHVNGDFMAGERKGLLLGNRNKQNNALVGGPKSPLLSNVFRMIDKQAPSERPKDFHEITGYVPKTPSVAEAKEMEADKKDTLKQLSLVEDFLRTKITDVSQRPSFASSNSVTTANNKAITRKNIKTSKAVINIEEMRDEEKKRQGDDLRNFFSQNDLMSHEIQKVDVPVFKKRKPPEQHAHTEFLLKAISPNPQPWDRRAKVTFKLSKKSSIPGRPQKVLGVYGSLRKKKKKKRKKKRYSEEEIHFASTKGSQSKKHKSKLRIKRSRNSKSGRKQKRNST